MTYHRARVLVTSRTHRYGQPRVQVLVVVALNAIGLSLVKSCRLLACCHKDRLGARRCVSSASSFCALSCRTRKNHNSNYSTPPQVSVPVCTLSFHRLYFFTHVIKASFSSDLPELLAATYRYLKQRWLCHLLRRTRCGHCADLSNLFYH